MTLPVRYRLSDQEKDALLTEQAALIERQAARIAELEALLAKPKKTSQNSHTPSSQDRKLGGAEEKKNRKRRKPRPSRPGSARPLTDVPDETVKRLATACPHCAADVSGQTQTCRRCYDYIDIPPIRPHVTRIELWGGRCGACGKRYCATPPDSMAPGTPFGASIRSLLLYLHHSHHVGFARLARMMAELFGLKISEGAIANAFRRTGEAMAAACAAIREKLRAARVIASDETTSRIDGTTHWHWVFASARAVLHQIAPRRAKAVAEDVLGDRKPEVWVSDRYAGQQDLGLAHRVCLAHVLRDVQYAIDCGDTVFAPSAKTQGIVWILGLWHHLSDEAIVCTGVDRGGTPRLTSGFAFPERFYVAPLPDRAGERAGTDGHRDCARSELCEANCPQRLRRVRRTRAGGAGHGLKAPPAGGAGVRCRQRRAIASALA